MGINLKNAQKKWKKNEQKIYKTKIFPPKNTAKKTFAMKWLRKLEGMWADQPPKIRNIFLHTCVKRGWRRWKARRGRGV